MPSSSPDDTVRLFLSYGREDFEAVSELYDRLEGLGLRPWMDKRDLLPGQQWRVIIPRQVQQCDLVLVCLSPQSVDKRGSSSARSGSRSTPGKRSGETTST